MGRMILSADSKHSLLGPSGAEPPSGESTKLHGNFSLPKADQSKAPQISIKRLRCICDARAHSKLQQLVL